MKKFRLVNVGTVVSITLVLIFLGLVGKFSTLSYYFKEKAREDIGFNVFLAETADEKETKSLIKAIEARPETKTVEYSSKEDALKQFIEEGNENPVDILDYNPLPASIHVFVVDSFLDKTKLSAFASYISKMPDVQEVKYAEDFLNAINDNIQKITLAMLGIVGLLLIVSFVLIHNTIRLTMLNDRFIIKTMQYAGASNFFIASPYLKRSVLYGMMGGIFASLVIVGVNKYLSTIFEQWSQISSFKLDFWLFIALLLVGTLLAFFSTLSSVYKYLKTSLSKLY